MRSLKIATIMAAVGSIVASCGNHDSYLSEEAKMKPIDAVPIQEEPVQQRAGNETTAQPMPNPS